MSTKYDSTCLHNAADDEPVFVLRAQDATAHDVVQKWIDLNVDRLGFTHPKIRAAIEMRNQMATWPSQKLPD